MAGAAVIAQYTGRMGMVMLIGPRAGVVLMLLRLVFACKQGVLAKRHRDCGIPLQGQPSNHETQDQAAETTHAGSVLQHTQKENPAKVALAKTGAVRPPIRAGSW
jgi:hypothetical protein